MNHPRVVNCHHNASYDVYVGRGRCPPRLCHAEILARLADGADLKTIRDDVLERLPDRNLELFA